MKKVYMVYTAVFVDSIVYCQSVWLHTVTQTHTDKQDWRVKQNKKPPYTQTNTYSTCECIFKTGLHTYTHTVYMERRRVGG